MTSRKQSNRLSFYVTAILISCFGVWMWSTRRWPHPKQVLRPNHLLRKLPCSCAVKLHLPFCQKASKSKNGSAAPLGICSHLPLGKTTSSIWRQHLSEIFYASIHPFDEKSKYQIHGNWTRSLLQLLPPSTLQRGIRVSPNFQPGSPWQNVMTKLARKLQHVDDPTIPAVQIAIFGGSVTEGRICQNLPLKVSLSEQQADNWTSKKNNGRSCSWPARLQWMIDRALGKPGIVVLHNLAVGGTGSGASLPVIQHWLYPKRSVLRKGVDVIVNSYATNDNLPQWNRPRNTTIDSYHMDSRRVGTQEFLKTCRLSQPCNDPPPLVLYFDDYVGNQGDVLLGEMQGRHVTEELGHYGDGIIGQVSSMDAFWRSLILPDVDETLLSAEWTNRRVEVHFRMPGHVARAWLFAFGLLQWTVDYCHDQLDHSTIRQKYLSQVGTFNTTTTATSTAATASSPIAEHQIEGHGNQDRTKRLSLGPQSAVVQLCTAVSKLANVYEMLPSTKDLRLFNITNVWNRTVQRQLDSRSELECYKHTLTTVSRATELEQTPCTFAFVAAPMGTHSSARSLNSYVNRFATINENWTAKEEIRFGWQNKLGLFALSPYARLLLRLPNITKPMKVVSLYYLRSYGDDWQIRLPISRFPSCAGVGLHSK